MKEPLTSFYDLTVVDLDLIDRDPGQPRKQFDPQSIKELADSIKEKGLIQPPVLKLNTERRGRYKLVAGERRLRALRHAGFTSAKCLVWQGDPDTYIMSAIENAQRRDLDPIDEAQMFLDMRESKGLTLEAIRKLTGRSVTTIINHLNLLDLPLEIQNMVRLGTLPQRSALNLGQYKGHRGDLIRRAYDLMDGKEVDASDARPIETSKIGKKMIAAKLPTTADGLLRRLLNDIYRTRSWMVIIGAFEEKDIAEQRVAWGALDERVRNTFLTYARSLSTALTVLAGTLGDIDEKIPKHPPPKSASTVSTRVVSHSERKRVRTPEPGTRPTFRLPSQINDGLIKTALRVLLYRQSEKRQEPEPNLSASRFAERMSTRDAVHANGFAFQIFRLLRAAWLVAPCSGDLATDEFIRFTANIRADFGDERDFGAFIRRIQRKDTSSDPVDLTMFTEVEYAEIP